MFNAFLLAAILFFNLHVIFTDFPHSSKMSNFCCGVLYVEYYKKRT